jgi:hypothetical protein
MGGFRAAAFAFDAARREVASRQRPWHRALIRERAGRFYPTHGLEHEGYELLALAREQYLAWGAVAKADQIDWAYPGLNPLADAVGETTVGEAGVGTIGIGEAGQVADHPRRCVFASVAEAFTNAAKHARALGCQRRRRGGRRRAARRGP